ncbi:hypothetical protein DFJ73DRAFT_827024 [Zopfochytrium polystomum]|nr:hypothetical protein DFJ73DRAFT_827024 [Zopfochytrium polystomum]
MGGEADQNNTSRTAGFGFEEVPVRKIDRYGYLLAIFDHMPSLSAAGKVGVQENQNRQEQQESFQPKTESLSVANVSDIAVAAADNAGPDRTRTSQQANVWRGSNTAGFEDRLELSDSSIPRAAEHQTEEEKAAAVLAQLGAVARSAYASEPQNQPPLLFERNPSGDQGMEASPTTFAVPPISPLPPVPPLTFLKHEDKVSIPYLAMDLRGRRARVSMDGCMDRPRGTPRQGFACSQCNAVFSRRWNQKIHESTHNEHRVPSFACPSCSKSFYHKKDLTRHTKGAHPNALSSGGRCSICASCGQPYTRQETLPNRRGYSRCSSCASPTSSPSPSSGMWRGAKGAAPKVEQT